MAAAEAAGYEKFLPCFDDPVEGGMGQHWANMALIGDGIADPAKPEVLVGHRTPYGVRWLAPAVGARQSWRRPTERPMTEALPCHPPRTSWSS